MTRNIHSKLDISGFNEIETLFKKGFLSKVGILGDKDARPDGSPEGNAEIGLKQEFGSISENIPPRSFLRMPVIDKKSDFAKYMSSSKVKKLVAEKKIKQIFVDLGLIAEKIIQEAFETRGFGKWKPNAPMTIRLKGSDSPLIDTGQLRRSITSTVIQKGQK